MSATETTNENTVLGKIETGTRYKDDGNQFVKSGEYKQALGCYHRALLYITGLDNSKLSMGLGLSDTENTNQQSPLEQATREKIKLLLIATHSNMAMCYLKLSQFDKAIKSCEKVLSQDPNNAKAMFRKGEAFVGLNDLQHAFVIFRSAVKIAPQDVGIRKSLKEVEDRLKELEKKSNDELRKNMAKMAGI
ncbi:hypothetical protein BC833DRAFT_574566 [Globomyces pollinis-pini]|nr:hypothetical protein BC833DRAFT_574566 [Globomyces pollinis-pini]KAJ3000470.1 hypothetical protein HDV02_005335 [Globomyces sp. JEL0801]